MIRTASIVVLCAFGVLARAQTPDRAPLPLSLKRAVEIAVSPEGNTRVQLAEESVKQAESRRPIGPRQHR